jgi:hypothetical protein
METVPPDLAAPLREIADAQGWLPPWPQWWGEEVLAGLIPDPHVRRRFAASCPRRPLAMFEEVHPPAPQWPDAPAAYLQLSEAYQDHAAKARELGWPVTQQASHPSRAADRPGPGHPITARAARPASPQAVAPPRANATSAVACHITPMPTTRSRYRATPPRGLTLSDGESHGEHAPTRCSARR